MSKGISAGRSRNAYRGLVQVGRGASAARNYTQCDSLLMGDRCAAHTFPYMEVKNPGARVEHEATTSKIGEDQLFYCMSRGLSAEDAVSMIVNGFCKDVFNELPMEFAVEARNLLNVSLEGANRLSPGRVPGRAPGRVPGAAFAFRPPRPRTAIQPAVHDLRRRRAAHALTHTHA